MGRNANNSAGNCWGTKIIKLFLKIILRKRLSTITRAVDAVPAQGFSLHVGNCWGNCWRAPTITRPQISILSHGFSHSGGNCLGNCWGSAAPPCASWGARPCQQSIAERLDLCKANGGVRWNGDVEALSAQHITFPAATLVQPQRLSRSNIFSGSSIFPEAALPKTTFAPQ